MVNNGGNIGKTLQQLGSSDSVKSLVTTMVTAGALSSLDEALGFTNNTQTPTGQTAAAASGVNGIATSQAANSFTQNLLKNITNNVAGAAIGAALNGQSLNESTLANALSRALVTAGMASGANAIGDARQSGDLNAFTQNLAHAVLGCAGGAAIAGNGGGCSAGAVGAVVGELTANYVLSHNGTSADALALAKTLSAMAGVLVGGGGDNVAAVNIASTTGTSAAENNYLRHAEALRLSSLESKKASGQCDAACERDIADLKALDIARNQALANCVGINSDKCNNTRQLVRTAAAEYIRNGENFNTRGSDYAWQYVTTTELAYKTIPGKSSGTWAAIGDMISSFIDVMSTAYKAKDGDPQAITQIVAGSRAVASFLSDSSNLPYLVGVMTPAQRQVFATAVENNDGTTVGKMLTDQTLALAGAVSLVGDAAKLASVTSTALREAAIASATNASARLNAMALDALGKSGGAFDASGNAILDMSKLTNNQKSLIGDLFGQATVSQIVPDGQKIARIPGVGETVLDDLYKVNRPGVDYVNVEYKFVGDSKDPNRKTDLGSVRLKPTDDGLQGSTNWITGSDRIEKAVGSQGVAEQVYNSGACE